MTATLELTRPFDAHLHLRDGAALDATVPASARDFAGALVMPNLAPPITTVAEALAYRERVLARVPAGADFTPRFALYLTDRTAPDEVRRVADCEHVLAFKLYPAGATTNSEHGVTDLAGRHAVLAEMERQGVPLCVHGEETAPEVDVFDRERVFLERTLAPLVERFAGLRVVFEHVTTREAAQYVEGARAGVAASLTPQHLLMSRNDLFVGGLRPHHYCLPVLKREEHRRELVRVATGGDPRFFLGSDSAPHARGRKESACGCAGCYSAPAALALYAQAFEAAEALPRLEAFAALHGPAFYGLAPSAARVTLVRERWRVPERLDFTADDAIVPYWAGAELAWRVA
ncbi:MAG: dihydroorotase [Planctomycetes bacterium]|nr:dihydroorotase [Planctomycetota bacterium]